MTADIVSLPAFQHTETCDALTIGRAVMALDDAGRITLYIRGIIDNVADYRQPCDCGKLRLSAIETELTALWKWQRNSPERFTAGPAEAVADQIKSLVARRDAIRAELAR